MVTRLSFSGELSTFAFTSVPRTFPMCMCYTTTFRSVSTSFNSALEGTKEAAASWFMFIALSFEVACLPSLPCTPEVSSPSTSIILPLEVSSNSVIITFGIDPELSAMSPKEDFTLSRSLVMGMESTLIGTSPCIFIFFSTQAAVLYTLLATPFSGIMFSTMLLLRPITSIIFAKLVLESCSFG